MGYLQNFLASNGIWLSWVLAGVGIPGLLFSLYRLHFKHKHPDPKRRKWPYITLAVLAGLATTAAIAVTLADPVIRRALLSWMSAAGVYRSLIWTGIAGILISVLSRLVRITLLHGTDDIRTKHKIRRTVQWGTAFVFGLTAMFIWASHLQSLGVFLGMFAAGLALSLQETLLCLAGWVLLVIKKPFDIGDRIEINGMTGDVIDIQTFHMYLLEVGNWVDGDQSTGRMISIPNSVVFRGNMYNYTKGFPFIWNEIKTIVTFDSNWQYAKEIILEQAQEEVEKIEREVRRQIQNMQRDYAIRYENLTPIVYTTVEDIGVALTLRYLTPVRNRRGTQHKISESILEEFAKASDIRFAYPTQTIYTASAQAGRPLTNLKRPMGGGGSEDGSRRTEDGG